MDPASMDVEQMYRSISDLRRILGSPAWRDLIEVPVGVDEATLAAVQSDILDVTVHALRGRSAKADTQYLRPLVEADVRGIATLNFDTLVEAAAVDCAGSVVTGVDEWDGGFEWPTPSDGTPLLKLHGSLNWHQELRKAGPIPIGGLRTLDPDAEYRFGGSGIFSDLRFGLENKLSQAGPMPALLAALTRLLERSDLVVAVGYSFRDPHVDVALDRWAAFDDARRLLIVDPGRDEGDPEALEKSGSDWFGHLVAGLRHDVLPRRQERLRVLAESAETALTRLFG